MSSIKPVQQQTTHNDERYGSDSGSDIEKFAGPPPGAFNPAENPDGGTQAWLCVLGGFCLIFCSFGWINIVGVFQEYYQTHQLSNYSPGDIAWIPSLQIFLQFALGPIVGGIIDSYGTRWVMIVGSLLHIFGVMMLSLCKTYWQILLAQGVCSAIGVGLLFYPATTTIVTWFFKKRGMAFGLITTGSSVGGVILPIMVQQLIPKVGFGWAVRVAGFLMLALLIVANLTVTSRLPPSKKPIIVKEFFYPLKEPPYDLLVFGSFFVFLGLFIPINYIITEAIHYGVSPDIAQYLVPILNAASFFGRVIPGALGDKVGRFNMLIAMCLLNAILILAMWIPSTTSAPIIVFAAFYGFSSGAFVSSGPACIAQISDVRKIGVRNGTYFAVISIAGLISNPIGGALITNWKGEYTGLQIFAGVTCFGGTCLILASRIRLAGWKLATRF